MVGNLPQNPSDAALEMLTVRANVVEERALVFDKDAKDENRPSIETEQRELPAQRWLSEQRAAVEAEGSWLLQVHRLEQAKKLTNTQQLTLKKSNLSDQLITTAYVTRFQDQLIALGAGHLGPGRTKRAPRLNQPGRPFVPR
jgi:hypothetical protein